MVTINEVRKAIMYVNSIMQGRSDKEKFVPLLQRLKSEYDQLMSVGDLMDFAQQIAQEEAEKVKKPSNSNVVRLRRAG